MSKTILSLILLLTTVILLGFFLTFIFKSLFNPSKTAPYVSSFKKHLELMKKLKVKKGSKILDLGCGDGKALRFFNKNFDIIELDGYDINPYAVLIGKIINFTYRYKRIKLYKKNFYKAKLKGYNYIYIYLRPSQLTEIEDRIRKNKDKNTIIISNSFEFKKHKEFYSIRNKKYKKTIFLYK